MGQDVITCSAVCFFKHTLSGPYKPYPICGFLNRIDQCSLEAINLYPCRSLKANSQWRGANIFNKCVESRSIFSRHFMLNLYSVHHAAQVPDRTDLFSSSSGVGTKGFLDLSCCSYPQSGDRHFS